MPSDLFHVAEIFQWVEALLRAGRDGASNPVRDAALAEKIPLDCIIHYTATLAEKGKAN